MESFRAQRFALNCAPSFFDSLTLLEPERQAKRDHAGVSSAQGMGLGPPHVLSVAHVWFNCMWYSESAPLLGRSPTGCLDFANAWPTQIFLHLTCTKSVAGDRDVPSLESRWMWR